MSTTEEVLHEIRTRLLDLSRRNPVLNYKETSRTLRVVDELPDEVFRLLVREGRKLSLIAAPDESREPQEASETEADAAPHTASMSAFPGASPVALPSSPETPTESDSVELGPELPAATDQPAARHLDRQLQTPYEAAKLEDKARRIHLDARAAIEETGVNFLYLAIGFLEWLEPDNPKPCLAPLVLIPVELKRGTIDRESNCYRYVISFSQEDLETNLSLAKLLEQEFGLVLPEIELDQGAEGFMPDAYLAAVQKLAESRPGWKLRREMVLGLFSFARFLIYKDLDPGAWPANDSVATHPRVQELLLGTQSASERQSVPTIQSDAAEEAVPTDAGHSQTPASPSADPDPVAIDEAPLPLVLDADSSQLEALRVALSDQNLVIKGPPGTGKSQTISNLIALALSRGKSVLFVSEKLAALEVVKRRLDEIGLGDFCLELHSHKTQKRRALEEVRQRMERGRTRSRKKLDEESLARLEQELDRYAGLMSESGATQGISIHEAFWSREYWLQRLGGPTRAVALDRAEALTAAEIEARERLLHEYAGLLAELPPPGDNPWLGFRPTRFQPGSEEPLREDLRGLTQAVATLLDHLAQARERFGLPAPDSLGELHRLGQLDPAALPEPPESFVQERAEALLDETAGSKLAAFEQGKQRFQQQLDRAQELYAPIHSVPVAEQDELERDLERLIRLGLNERRFEPLGQLARNLREGMEALRRLEQHARQGVEGLQPRWESPADFAPFLDWMARVDDLPAELRELLGERPTTGRLRLRYEDARARREELEEERRQLASWFDLDTLPKVGELRELAQTLREEEGRLLSWFSSELKSARREIQSFLRPEKEDQLKQATMRRWLLRAADGLDAAESFARDEDLRLELGPLFRGLRTDWERLHQVVQHVERLRELAGSDEAAAAILSDFPRWRERQRPIAEDIRQALDRLLDQRPDLPAPAEALDANESRFDPSLEIRVSLARLEAHAPDIVDAIERTQRYGACETSTPADAREACRLRRDSTELAQSVDADEKLRELFGESFAGIATDERPYRATADWLESLSAAGIGGELLTWLARESSSQRRLRLLSFKEALPALLAACEERLDVVKRWGELDFDLFFGSEPESLSVGEQHRRLERCSDGMAYLSQWVDACHRADRAREWGLGEILDRIDRQELAPELGSACFHYSRYEQICLRALRKESDLTGFTRAAHEEAQRRFREIDRGLLGVQAKRIANELVKQKGPEGETGARVGDLTEMNLLRKEVSKKRRHLPLRQLISRAPESLQALKPCFMMSPLSVAKYLAPGKIQFDMVVMDEASQLRPEDALGAVARARQLVVVGDPKQLPPTPFFERIDDEAGGDQALTLHEAESILDVCASHGYAQRVLRWHYRSAHESLIAFSNESFYAPDGEDLVLFPTPHFASRELGVHSTYVEEGRFADGRNPVEAERVVAAVLEQIRADPELSIGIAALNRRQQDQIELCLERALKKDNALRRIVHGGEEGTEPLFIKNLENIQGDERDVIFLSTTYGPDPESDRVFQRFGPINGPDGWRRINVLVTRARRRVEVFTSMQPEDIRLGENSSRGVHALRSYLEYARNGNRLAAQESERHEPQTAFERSMEGLVAELGYRVKARVGAAGFFLDVAAHSDPESEEFLLGIESDGEAYSGTESARERDRLREEVLLRRGWMLHRIWSVDWFKNRELEVERLKAALQAAAGKV